MGRVRLLVWLLLFLVGAATEAPSVRSVGIHPWLADLLTGWCLLGCGLLAMSREDESGTGPLLVATGATWFLGNVATLALYFPRALLFHVTLSYPTGRLKGRLERATIIVGYAVAVVPPAARSAAVTVGYSTLVGIVAVWRRRHCVGAQRKARDWSVAAVLALSTALIIVAAVRLFFPTIIVRSATLDGYQVAICLLSVTLVAGLTRRPWDVTNMATDLVVELTEARSGAVRDALAAALGDPTLTLTLWDPDTGSWIGAAGEQVLTPAVGSGRRITRVERQGHPIALLAHDVAVLDDPALDRALEAAASLAETNARLEAEVESQILEVERSRRRLVLAEGDARRLLAHEVGDGVGRRLKVIGDLLAEAVKAGYIEAVSAERVQSQLRRTETTLRDLAAGLHPGGLLLGGLEAAVNRLAASSTIPVDVRFAAGAMAAEVEAAVYYVCSEALANITKHARSSYASVRVMTIAESIRVEVLDDGIGGAIVRPGSGLQGLEDRVAALGGSFALGNRVGGGTVLTVEVPLLWVHDPDNRLYRA